MIKIGSEFKYRLTRMCIDRGLLSLPANMRGLFPEEGSAIAKDLDSGIEYELQVLSPRKILGFREFMRQHHLQVNDFIVIRIAEDGSYILSPQTNRKKTNTRHKPVNVKKILDEIYVSGVPYSEEEIRQSYNLPASINIAADLSSDKRFMLKSGRWQKTIDENEEIIGSDYKIKIVGGKSQPRNSIKSESQEKQFYKEEPLQEEALSRQNKLKGFLRSIGYNVTVLSPNRLFAEMAFGRHSYRVLLTILTKGSEINWSDMIEQRRINRANYSAIIGEHADLLRLTSFAETGKASLWSWQGLDRLMAYSETMAISPIDLEPHFAKDGLFEEGLEKFQFKINKMIEAKGKFSSVLTRLARLKPYTVFLLDEVQVEGCSREEVLRILGSLEQDPFQLIQKVSDGEFLLRQSVRSSLAGVAEYASTLRSHLPNRTKDRIEIHTDEISEGYYAP